VTAPLDTKEIVWVTSEIVKFRERRARDLHPIRLSADRPCIKRRRSLNRFTLHAGCVSARSNTIHPYQMEAKTGCHCLWNFDAETWRG